MSAPLSLNFESQQLTQRYEVRGMGVKCACVPYKKKAKTTTKIQGRRMKKPVRCV